MSKYATFLRVIYDDENIIYSSGVSLTTNPIDKFFYDFQGFLPLLACFRRSLSPVLLVVGNCIG